MIITKPRDWERLRRTIDDVGARRVFLVGCGQCATQSQTGGEAEVLEAKRRFEAEGLEVTGWVVGEVTCHLNGTKLEMRKNAEAIEAADALVVFSCGAGVQCVAEAVSKPVLPALESAFLGNVIRSGMFEERCQMCGDCVLDRTAGICPVTTCPKGLLNGPCGGMWDGMCEVLTDRECAHVRIYRRLAEQGRTRGGAIEPKDYSAKMKPGSINLRESRRAKGGAE